MPYLLSEENIQHATLSFLKTYYKNNSSRGLGATEAKLNMQTGSGIIADGYLKFSVDADPLAGLSAKEAVKMKLEGTEEKNKQKETFLATFEATSQATAPEIQYRVQRTLLLLDALAVASIVAALSYGYNYLNDQFTVRQLGAFRFFAGFVAVLLSSAAAYSLLFRKLSRYRYIYALAQFRRYHADEQWVSYGEDVFATPENKYLVELKKQCVRQGFGLISVDEKLQPALLITPSRQPIGRRKKFLKFIENKTKDRKSLRWINELNIGKLNTAIDRSKDYTRYTKSYWKQGLVLLTMLFVIAEIYIAELKDPDLIVVNERRYEAEMEELAAKNEREPLPYEVELEDGSTRLVDPREIATKPTKSEPSTTAPKSRPQPPATPAAPPVVSANRNRPEAFIISTGLGNYVSYDCTRLSNIKDLHYLVQIATATTSAEAIRRVQTFNELGFQANALWLGCFLNRDLYVVYLDDIFSDRNAAANRLEKYQKLLIAKNQSPDSTVLRAINSNR